MPLVALRSGGPGQCTQPQNQGQSWSSSISGVLIQIGAERCDRAGDLRHGLVTELYTTMRVNNRHAMDAYGISYRSSLRHLLADVTN